MPDSLPIDNLVNRSATTFGSQTAPGEIDKEGFLKLLIEQMKHQDPMNPMDSTEYSSQLAQFSTLEEMQNQSVLLEQGLQSDFIMTQSITNTLAGSLVGTDVKAFGGTIAVEDGEGSPVSFELPQMAEKVEILIKDGDGNEVRHIEIGRSQAGEHSVEWDGRDNSGRDLADGNYSVEVNMIDGDGNSTAVTPCIIGTVDAVRFGANGAMLVVDGVEVMFGDVLELRNPDDDRNGGGLDIAGLIGLGGSQ